MAGMFGDVIMAILAAAFAIAAIIVIFAVAGHFFNEIVEAFRKGVLQGIGMTVLCLVGLMAVVYGVHYGWPYAVQLYRQVTG